MQNGLRRRLWCGIYNPLLLESTLENTGNQQLHSPVRAQPGHGANYAIPNKLRICKILQQMSARRCQRNHGGGVVSF
jgi:hypothetical protein